LNRGLDAEAGGVADLQTDVMRFMAILALCLVAIFALVQSIPLSPETAGSAAPAAPVKIAADIPVPDVTQPRSPAEEIPDITRPQPQPVKRLDPPVDKASPAAMQVPAPPAEHAVAEAQGFTRRFVDDQALTRLVARNEVGLYAIAPHKSLRMNVNRGTLSFWPASVPNEFHEMDEATVPDDVRSAYRRAGTGTEAVKWGVTLPAGMQRQLNAYLSESAGGTLTIDAHGNVILEP
jgi:hypothetical protein